MIITPEILTPDFFIAIGFIGGLIGGLFSGITGGSKSKSQSGPPAYSQEAGRALLDYALGRDTGNLPTSADLLAAAGPTLGQQLSAPGVNWYDILGGSTQNTNTNALDAVFSQLAQRSAMPTGKAPMKKASNIKGRMSEPEKLATYLRMFGGQGNDPFRYNSPIHNYYKMGGM